MNCPVDNTPLAMTERQGVEIDYCPTCRGVWLDRGELDKIIERAPGNGGERGEVEEERDDEKRPGRKKRRRESFLGDLFDFGG